MQEAAPGNAENNLHPSHQNHFSGVFSDAFSKEEVIKDTERKSEKFERKESNFSQDTFENTSSTDNVHAFDVRGRSRRDSEQNYRRTLQPYSNRTFMIVLITIMVIVVIAAAVVTAFVIRGRNQNDAGTTQENSSITANEAQSTKLKNAETYYVTQASSHLSMRSEADSKSSIVGDLYNGNSVKVLSKSGDYWYVYSDDLKAYGYVDRSYLTADHDGVVYNADDAQQGAGAQRKIGVGSAPQSYEFVRYAYVNSGYLALRSEQETSDSNIIGELYNYYPVQVISATGIYWYVYSPDLKMYGYVNSNYLIGETNSANYDTYNTNIYYASVRSGYLALRSDQTFDLSNEIGKLYSGDKVEVLDYSGVYWYVYVPTLGICGYVNSEYLTQ